MLTIAGDNLFSGHKRNEEKNEIAYFSNFKIIEIFHNKSHFDAVLSNLVSLNMNSSI